MRGETHLFRVPQAHDRRPPCHRARHRPVQRVLLRAGPCNRHAVLRLRQRCPFPTMNWTRRNR